MDLYQVTWRGLRMYAYHGYFPEERILGSWYELDIQIGLLTPSTLGDDLSQTVDYSQVYQICRQIMNEPVDLLETIVEKIGKQLTIQWPRIKTLEISLKKENPPLGLSKGNSCVLWTKIFE